MERFYQAPTLRKVASLQVVLEELVDELEVGFSPIHPTTRSATGDVTNETADL